LLVAAAYVAIVWAQNNNNNNNNNKYNYDFKAYEFGRLTIPYGSKNGEFYPQVDAIMPQAIITDIVSSHNQFRQMVVTKKPFWNVNTKQNDLRFPKAKSMKKISWDADLAESARKYAKNHVMVLVGNRCDSKHSTEDQRKFSEDFAGENIAAWDVDNNKWFQNANGTQLANRFINRESAFVTQDSSGNVVCKNKLCSHFRTAMYWETTKIGCAISNKMTCKNQEWMDVVCHYYPAPLSNAQLWTTIDGNGNTLVNAPVNGFQHTSPTRRPTRRPTKRATRRPTRRPTKRRSNRSNATFGSDDGSDDRESDVQLSAAPHKYVCHGLLVIMSSMPLLFGFVL
jgi:hypothetical protein